MLLFLDIDGTVCETLSGERFGKHPKDYKLMPGTLEALAKLSKETLIIGISNQGGVDHGYKTCVECEEEQQFKLSLLPMMSAIYFCPVMNGKKVVKVFGNDIDHIIDDSMGLEPRINELMEILRARGAYRKPNPGMLELAIAWDAPNTDKSDIWMIGNSQEDCDAARAANINFAWAGPWRADKVQIFPKGSAII